MSNALAVPTVTGALWSILVDAFAKLGMESPPIVAVGALDDHEVRADGPCVGIHLYRVTPNPAAGLKDLPSRRPGEPAPQPRVALDLHYLLTFRGHDDWESQHLLAVAGAALHAEPLLTGARLAVVESDHPEIAGNDLADADERVRIIAEDLSLEELTRLWALYPPGSFALTLAVKAGPVLLEEAR